MSSFTLIPILKKFASVFIILMIPWALWAQDGRNVSGKVTDSSGNPVAGITVSLKNTNAATSTDVNGNFTLPANIGDVLIFTSVGYETLEVTITSVENLTVVLSEKKEVLSDVVVVGYGRGNRRTISSAITSIKPDELNKSATGDVGQLLQGKVAGLNITASGDPNRPAAVVLRGASTINSPGGPFYVIDGVPGADIAAIAPDDIASIDVLKDAAATAIYGNKASNGVIMVTTKKGRAGRMQAFYNGYVGFEKVSGSLDVMDAAQIKAFVQKSGNSISPNDDLGQNTDWMKAIQRPRALSQNHNISFSGGSEKSLYSASLNYLDKEGILLKSNLKRLIARLSLEQYVLNDKLKLGLNLSNANSKAQNTPLRNVVLLQAARYLPVSPVYRDDGSYFENFNTTRYYNPVFFNKSCAGRYKI